MRFVNTTRVKVRCQFERGGVWVGVFWRHRSQAPSPYSTFHLSVCLVPCLPLHVTVLLKERPPR